MTEQTAASVLRTIHAEAEASRGEPRFVRTCREGDEIRQGDIYLYPLDGTPPHRTSARASRQLAPGTGPGSRHVVVGEAEVLERLGRAEPLRGPYVCALERVVLTHPEHADISLPAGWYEVRYQRDFSAKHQVPQRVID